MLELMSLLSVIGGGVMRLLPSVIDFFAKGRELKYEVLRMEKEAELEKMRGQLRQEEIAAISSANVDASWAEGLVEALKSQTRITGDKWLDRINVSVRPILTYWWCIVIYTAYKAILTIVATNSGASLYEVANTIYTDFDRSVVGSIIGFWFVDRALRSSGLK